jgi:hypothetical protein
MMTPPPLTLVFTFTPITSLPIFRIDYWTHSMYVHSRADVGNDGDIHCRK